MTPRFRPEFLFPPDVDPSLVLRPEIAEALRGMETHADYGTPDGFLRFWAAVLIALEVRTGELYPAFLIPKHERPGGIDGEMIASHFGIVRNSAV